MINDRVKAQFKRRVRPSFYQAVRATCLRAKRGWQFASFRREFDEFSAKAKSVDERFAVRWEDRWPFFDDRTETTSFDAHYTYHPAWAARVLAQTSPKKHVDISSLLLFGAIVSAFVPVDFYDYRPADLRLSNLSSGSVNLVSMHFSDRSIESLSCMHTVEHVGLGRYGDQLDPLGDLKAMDELQRVLAAGGNLLFVVPVGRPKLQFNAQRIYSHSQIGQAFSDLHLVQFSLVLDADNGSIFVEDATAELADTQVCGCGCFWFRREQ
jgi:hypothetical protein